MFIRGMTVLRWHCNQLAMLKQAQPQQMRLQGSVTKSKSMWMADMCQHLRLHGDCMDLKCMINVFPINVFPIVTGMSYFSYYYY
jgi:hypothetical protein